jgi:hypothetical protein
MLKDGNQKQLTDLAFSQISDSYSVGTEILQNFL